MRGRWKTFWSTLFGNPHRWTGREKVLGYVVRRIDAGAPLREAVRGEYVRRNATRGEIERMLTDPRIVEGARERMRRDLGSGEPPTRRTPPRAGRPEASPKVGVWRHDGERR